MISLLAVSCGGFLGGCAYPQLKGTPFYSDDDGSKTTVGAERLNLWPLAYYDKPVMHLLWPFIEKTDDHFAVRPLMSVYGMAEDRPVYNVLWPIAQFNIPQNRHRIFPFFWGKEYFTAFPLYWHSGRPLSGEGSDGLIPLWWWNRSANGYNLHLLGPFINVRRVNGELNGCFWPLFGSYSDRSSRYRFYAWPLGHQWSSGSGEFGHTLLPLYWYGRDVDSSLLATIPFSRLSRADGTGWHLLFPLYYKGTSREGHTFATLLGGWRTDGDRRSWFATPLLTGGSTGSGSSNLWVVGPLGRFWSTRDSSRSYVFPLYYSAKDAKGSLLVTLPYSRGKNTGSGNAWELLLPLYYSQESKSGRMLVSLWGGYSRDKDSTAWMAWPVLSGGWKGADSGSAWYLGALAHAGWDKDSSRSYAFPLYYQSKDKAGRLFVSLPWTSRQQTDGSGWQFVPPFYYHSSGNQGDLTLTPIYAGGRSDYGKSRWHTVLPFYYRSRSDSESTFATLLGGLRTSSDGRRWFLTPLLSWGGRGTHGGDFWGLGPLLHARWDEQGVSHHVLPLYYWNGRNRTLVSPLWASWPQSQGGRTSVFPPAVSWLSGDGDDRQLWMLGPLARFGWGKGGRSSHVLPFYYYNQSNTAFVSLLGATWRRADGAQTYLFPPALSWTTRNENRTDLWMLGPLAHFSWGEKAGAQHVAPLYYYNRNTGTLVSPLWSTWRDGSATKHLISPILGMYTRNPNSKELTALLGLFHNRWGDPARDASGYAVPLYYYEGSHTFHSLLFGWDTRNASGYFYPLTPLIGFRTGDRSGGWLFPLFSYTHDAKRDLRSARLLWGSYRREGERTYSGFFPLYGYENNPLPNEGVHYGRYGKSFWCLPACWYSDYSITTPVRGQKEARGTIGHTRMMVKKHGVFPLWHHSSREIPARGEIDQNGSVLAFCYYHKKEVKPSEGTDRETSRLLGLLWSRRRDREDVSVDMPGITYDRKPNGHKRFTILMRLFRYETDTTGTTLDILFIPILRPGSKSK